MISERTGEQTPEFEIPNWAWGGLGIVIGFALTFWLGFGIMADITTIDPAAANTQPTPPPGTDEIRAVATEFAFSHQASSTAGVVAIGLVNEGQAFHNLLIESVDGTAIEGFILETEPGEEVTGEIELAPGSYTLFCSVPGHRDAGMESALDLTE